MDSRLICVLANDMIEGVMKDIPIADYPTPRTWCMKAQAAPNIPRGSMGMTGALRIILEDVASGKPQTSPVGIPGSDSEVTLGVCCQRLRPVGLVRDKNGSWSLSEEAEKWLSSKDDGYLAAVLCANTKYLGEILYLLQKPMKASMLQEIATTQYFMPWKKYYPGGKAELISTLTAYIAFFEAPRTREEVEAFSTANYGIKPSSARSFLNMLSGIGFVERASRNRYQATELAILWNKDANPLNMCCCLHKACMFVFEILHELKNRPKTKNDLSAASIVKYGFEKENGSEILKRIHFLQLAGLLRDHKADEFAITQAGEKLLESVSVQSVCESVDSSASDSIASTPVSCCEELLAELHLSSKDSSNHGRFERACAEAFKRLGFKSEWLGGSGKTDVLASTYSAAKYAYRITIDAKSTANGLVNESQLNFDTLVDHRKRHDAQFAIVVGCGFQGERVVSRAIKHKIVLIDVESLCKLIRLHEKTPLSAQDYKNLFEKYGLADLNVLDPARSRLVRSGVVLHAVMDCLASESNDEVIGGTLSVRELYVLLKARNRGLSPSIDEIENMLAFLSSPMINCVGKTKGEYYAIGSLNEASNKFAFYANACLAH